MKRTVILSTNENPDYFKYLPYVQKAWNMLGWNTLTFYLGYNHDIITDPNENRIISVPAQPPYKDATIVQVMRLLAGNFIEDGLIMTGDVDMIPMADYWDPKLEHITVYGFDLTGYSEYPICYIAMDAKRWREIMPEQNIIDVLEKYPNALSDDFYKWWCVDQQLITKRINENAEENELMKIDRGMHHGLARGRVDRNDWEGTINYDGQFIDAHMPRPFNEIETDRIMNMIKIPTA